MRLLIAALTLAGCVTTNQVVCPDGRVCPETATCAEVASETYCAMPEQLELCASATEGDACTYNDTPSACHSGVCVPIACGNSLLDPGETCDDGNARSGDGCSSDCQSSEVCGNGRVDVVNREQCDDGNLDAHDGCAPSCVEESPVWTLVRGHRPDPRSETVLVYDARRQRTVMFGGRQLVVAGAIHLDDTIEWDGARWLEASPAVHPVRRYNHQMAYDAERATTVLFSGTNGAADTWLWNGATWQLAPTTTAPSPRIRAAMTYDARRKRVVLFGGTPLTTNVPTQDTWVWAAQTDGTMTWTELQPTTRPPARYNTHLAYDPKRDRVVLYGGTGSSGPLQDLWELDGDTWSPITFNGGPGARANGELVFDPVSQHILLIGGSVASPTDVWDWDGATWTKRPDNVPATVRAATTDAARGRVVAWSESVGIYELAGSTWVQPPSGAVFTDRSDTPPGRTEHSAAFDPVKRRVLVHGGYINDATATNETFVWDGTWSGSAPGPSARASAAMAYDRERGEFVLFGGISASGTYLQDTYTYSSAWTTEMPSTVPPARSEAAMAYDALNKQVVMFGGQGSMTTYDETWLWNGTDWALQAPATKPVAVRGATMAYDEERQQIVMFGGGDNNNNILADTWIWDGVARNWIKQAPAVTPNQRYVGRMAWDSRRRRLVLFGGRIDLSLFSVVPEVWEWTGTNWELVLVSGGPRRTGHHLVDGLDGGVVMLQGRDATNTYDDTWQLRWDGPATYETCTAFDVDNDGLAGCADVDCASVCVPCGDGACAPGIETCASCSEDCGPCAATCGDFVCGASEQCPGDCP